MIVAEQGMIITSLIRLTRGSGLSYRGVHSHESQELSYWSPGRWLLRRNVHAHDESWERASGPKSSAICRSVSSTSPQSREGHGDIEGRDGKIGRAQDRGNRSNSRQDDAGLIFWLNQGEQRLHDCRQGQGKGRWHGYAFRKVW